MVTKAEKGVGGGINQETGINIYIPLCVTQINKDLLYSIGNYIQYLVINYKGKESEKEQIYVYIYINYESECVSHTVMSHSVTPWTTAHQAPLSMEIYRKEYWNGLPFPSPGHRPDPGIGSGSPALQAQSLQSGNQGSPIYLYVSGSLLFLSPTISPRENHYLKFGVQYFQESLYTLVTYVLLICNINNMQYYFVFQTLHKVVKESESHSIVSNSL